MPNPKEDPEKKKKPTAEKASASAVKKKPSTKPSTKRKKTVKRVSSKKTTNRTPRQPKNPDEKIVGRGRPLKFKTVKELKEAIEAYFKGLYRPVIDRDGIVVRVGGEVLMEKTEVATVTGLAVALDTSRETLMDYEKGIHDEKCAELSSDEKAENEQIEYFSDTIKKAKLRIYADTEQQLYHGKPTGAIFSLKNNYGWEDKQKVENEDVSRKNPFKNLTEEELRKLAGRTK